MRKIGITGSLASGKTTASKILSKGKGRLFSADEVVKQLYKKKSFKKLILQRFNISDKSKIKIILRNKILKNKKTLTKLEKIIHPLVRKEMRSFISKNKKKLMFFEILLLVESKLMKKFDIIFFIKAESTRLKRYMIKGGDKKFFDILNNKQLSDSKKIKYCDHIIVNIKFKVFKKKLLDIFKDYE